LILIFFGTNITEKVGNQKVLFLFPVLRNEMLNHKNSILSLKCCTIALPDLNQSLA